MFTLGQAGSIIQNMKTLKDAEVYGRRIKKFAVESVVCGDCGTIVLDVEWQLGERSYKLGIVGADGRIDLNGEIANAFRRGFKRRVSIT